MSMVLSLRRALALLLLWGPGCSADAPRKSSVEADLDRVKSRLAEAATVRVHIEGQWSEVGPYGIRRPLRGNPRSFSSDLLLGEGERARLTLVVTDMTGAARTYRVISDGRRVWLNEPGLLPKVSRNPEALRRELTSAISSSGIGSWFAAHAPFGEPSSRGDDFPMPDGLPPDAPRPGHPLFDPPHEVGGTSELQVINHYCPAAKRRVRVGFDPSSGDLRKRDVLGSAVVWCAESYSQLQIGMKIPEAEFQPPE